MGGPFIPAAQSQTNHSMHSSKVSPSNQLYLANLRNPFLKQTRITSKYTVLKPTASKIKKRQKYLEKKAARPAKQSQPEQQQQQQTSSATDPTEPTTTFTLKTYDPESGICLQYQTSKAAEVGRLIGSLGRLGRHMAALPEIEESASAPVAGKEDEDVKTADAPAPAAAAAAAAVEQKPGGGGKKKKKGKK